MISRCSYDKLNMCYWLFCSVCCEEFRVGRYHIIRDDRDYVRNPCPICENKNLDDYFNMLEWL